MSDTEQKHNPQSKVWEDIGIYKEYKIAKKMSDSFEGETKIRRCGRDGKFFKVKIIKKHLEIK
jgi:hypothetical protein